MIFYINAPSGAEFMCGMDFTLYTEKSRKKMKKELPGWRARARRRRL